MSNRFTTWEIDKSGLQQLKKNIKSLNSNHIEYGILNKEVYPANDPNGRAGKSVAEVAKDNEYGFDFINQSDQERTAPPRPYFYQSIITSGKFVAKESAEHIFSTLSTVNNAELKLAMQLTADTLADTIRAEIDSQDFIPNAPVTLARKEKRSHEILKNTSTMYAAFSGKVVKGTVPT